MRFFLKKNSKKFGGMKKSRTFATQSGNKTAVELKNG